MLRVLQQLPDTQAMHWKALLYSLAKYYKWGEVCAGGKADHEHLNTSSREYLVFTWKENAQQVAVVWHSPWKIGSMPSKAPGGTRTLPNTTQGTEFMSNLSDLPAAGVLCSTVQRVTMQSFVLQRRLAAARRNWLLPLFSRFHSSRALSIILSTTLTVTLRCVCYDIFVVIVWTVYKMLLFVKVL